MEKREIMEQVMEIVKETLEADQVAPGSRMQEDLELESLNFYELLGALENHFRIRIPEKILADTSTVKDIADVVIHILDGKR